MFNALNVARRKLVTRGLLAGGLALLGGSAAGAHESRHFNNKSDDRRGGRRRMIVERPVLVLIGDGAATLHEPAEAPFAYFDAGTNELFVDPERRAELASIIQAEVKADLWTFPIQGGEARQAKEEPIDLWDPAKDPLPGNFRILNRECVDVTYTYNCEPIRGVNPPEWIKCTLDVGRCLGRRERPCREDYGVVGICPVFSDAQCTVPAGSRNMLHWQCLEI